jgi:predicted alpha/beta superfamily hydrolase
VSFINLSSIAQIAFNSINLTSKSTSMKVIFLLLFSSVISLTSFAIDLTITLTSIPSNTPVSDQIYICGSFNNWAVGSANSILQVQTNGTRKITLTNVSGTIEFKFNRGNWDTPEGTAQGGFIPNRTYNTANGSSLNLTIAGWEDLPVSGTSTAIGNVQILSTNFNMPQLNRNRKIWLYLPSDYNTATTKNYPVIYMHDAQNLFDQNTSFSGEWQVDETLAALQSQGNYGAIVVGIDNGGSERINEYSPWVNTQYGGGQGDEYIDFIKNTLKPYIDANFRTKTDAQNTALFGSSMGGLISLYGVATYPSTFGKAGIFSPSIWFARTDVMNYINGKNFTSTPLRLYFLGGTTESTTLVSDMQAARNAFISKGVVAQEAKLLTHTDGAHSEWYWRREFGAAYTFLFPNPTSDLNEIQETDLHVFPNPSNDSFNLECHLCQDADFTVKSAEGKIVAKGKLENGKATLDARNFKKGIYFIQLVGSDSKTALKVVVE